MGEFKNNWKQKHNRGGRGGGVCTQARERSIALDKTDKITSLMISHNVWDTLMPLPFIAGVAYTMKMLLKILLALILCSHRTTVANSDSCEKTQCRLVPQTNDLSTTFSTTASERGVRLFYLYVKVNNNTYRPTNPSNKLRPARWAWARDIQEPMLSFSYDYDILSWGLLHHFQVRMMRVWLLD